MSKAGPLKPVTQMSFEACFKELEQLVEKFEHGQMGLSESVERFERGMELLKRCSGQLSEAEKKVEELLSKVSPAEQLQASEMKEDSE